MAMTEEEVIALADALASLRGVAWERPEQQVAAIVNKALEGPEAVAATIALANAG